jgi:hypothetical protein
MARNFGLTRRIDRSRRAPAWPMWVVTFALIGGVINAVMFLHPR